MWTTLLLQSDISLWQPCQNLIVSLGLKEIHGLLAWRNCWDCWWHPDKPRTSCFVFFSFLSLSVNSHFVGTVVSVEHQTCSQTRNPEGKTNVVEIFWMHAVDLALPCRFLPPFCPKKVSRNRKRSEMFVSRGLSGCLTWKQASPGDQFVVSPHQFEKWTLDSFFFFFFFLCFFNSPESVWRGRAAAAVLRCMISSGWAMIARKLFSPCSALSPEFVVVVVSSAAVRTAGTAAAAARDLIIDPGCPQRVTWRAVVVVRPHFKWSCGFPQGLCYF